MQRRWLSRKFLLTLSAQVAAVLVLLWPQQEVALVEACRSVAALAVMIVGTLGYVHTECAIDQQRVGDDPPVS